MKHTKHARLEHALARLRELAPEYDAERRDGVGPIYITTANNGAAARPPLSRPSGFDATTQGEP